MKKNISVLIVTVILIILIISSFVVHAKTNNENASLESKVSDEIQYLSNYIISLLGHFNSITVGDEIFQTSQPKTQLGKQETNPQKNNSSSGTNSQSEQEVAGTAEESGQEGRKGAQNSQSEENSSQSNQNEEANQGSKQGQAEGANTTSQGAGNGETSKTSSQNGNVTKNGIFANNGNYEANWETIQLKIQQLYQTWTTISIDLHALKIEGSSILAFSDGLNNTVQSIKKKDKAKAMEELDKIYQLLPKYVEAYDKDSQKNKLINIQAQVVSSYVLATNEKWQEVEAKLTQAEKDFASMLNTVVETKQNQNMINQCYILVNELRNVASLKDKDIFFIQYQNFITKMSIIE